MPGRIEKFPYPERLLPLVIMMDCPTPSPPGLGSHFPYLDTS